MKSIISVKCQIKPYFHDVDAMRVVWHGNYMRFFEEARSSLLDSIEYNYPEMAASGFSWPVVEMRIKYILPIVLHQRIIVEAHLVEYENRIKIKFIIRDAITNAILTKAEAIHVALCLKTMSMEYETPLFFQEKIRKLIG